MVVGVALIPLPGPGLLVIAIGLALLSLEFRWAERLLHRLLAWDVVARQRRAWANDPRRLLTATVVACMAGALVVAAVLLL
jgi:uncharacterized protein (TIGR02611 family)